MINVFFADGRILFVVPNIIEEAKAEWKKDLIMAICIEKDTKDSWHTHQPTSPSRYVILVASQGWAPHDQVSVLAQ